jgi:hypothetical protein
MITINQLLREQSAVARRSSSNDEKWVNQVQLQSSRSLFVKYNSLQDDAKPAGHNIRPHSLQSVTGSTAFRKTEKI